LNEIAASQRRGRSIGVFDSRSLKAAPSLFVPSSVRTINGTHLFAVKDQYTLVGAIASPMAAPRPTSSVLSSSGRAFPN
jgi:hypothetical protein